MPSEKCLVILAELTKGLSAEVCADRRQKARAVMCCARQKVEKGEGYSNSMKECWRLVRKHCPQSERRVP